MKGPEVASTHRDVAEPSIAESLQALRKEAGGVTYAEIATRISRLRAEHSGGAGGVGGAGFEVSRSTVYDAFRPGRTRLNPDLVVDIVLSLGVDLETAEGWRERCTTARPAVPRPSSRSTSSDSTTGADPAAAPRPASTERAGSVWSGRQRLLLIAATLLAALGVNLVGGELVIWLELPLFLDMIGTAVVAIALGPWYAVAVAIVTQFAAVPLHGNSEGLPFIPVAIVGALIWGYGARRGNLARSLPRFLLLSVVVALACTIVAVPITAAVFEGYSSHVAANSLTDRFQSVGENLVVAVASSNLTASVFDKLIAGFVGLAVGVPLRSRFATRPAAPLAIP